jgi:hypothetical protein
VKAGVRVKCLVFNETVYLNIIWSKTLSYILDNQGLLCKNTSNLVILFRDAHGVAE